MNTITSKPYIALKLAGQAAGFIGLGILVLAFFNLSPWTGSLGLSLALLLLGMGISAYSIGRYVPLNEGIHNNSNWHKSLTNRGFWAMILGVIVTTFYILLYWYPALLGLGENGEANFGLIAFFDPLSQFFKGQPASQWFVYGALYTLAILAFGVKFILKYQHNIYQQIRTFSVMFFQTCFAFILPEIMLRLNYPYNDFKNMWPLNYYFFDEWNVQGFLQSGGLGLFMLIFGIAMIFIISPILTYLYGKRWYCSWVCGCGGLAETAGDPFRHLSDKSLGAWKLERWLIHSILAFSFIMTIGVIYSYLNNNPDGFLVSKGFLVLIGMTIIGAFVFMVLYKKEWTHNLSSSERRILAGVGGLIFITLAINYSTGNSNAFFIDSYQLRSTYGFLVGAAFSGVVGVGFYPILGSRVWCRFGCPMAAILGIQQKWFSRFRITTNGGQCISCGNCSTYCEMGIDVRSYAQKGQNIVRASCVGCGVCAAVCPRGVLKLENGSVDIFERTDDLRTIHIKEGDVGVL